MKKYCLVAIAFLSLGMISESASARVDINLFMGPPLPMVVPVVPMVPVEPCVVVPRRRVVHRHHYHAPRPHYHSYSRYSYYDVYDYYTPPPPPRYYEVYDDWCW